MNNWGRLADIGTTLGAALTRNPEVLARTQAANDAVKLRKFGRRIFMENDPTKISEKELLEAAAEFDVPPDQAVEFVGRFFQQRAAREAKAKERMGVVSVPLGDGRYVKREVPASQIPGIVQQNPQAVAGQVYGSRTPQRGGGGGGRQYRPDLWKMPGGGYQYVSPGGPIPEGAVPADGGGDRPISPSQQLNAMKVAAWKRMYDGTADDQDRAIINQDRDPYFSDAMRAILQSPEGWTLPPEEVIRKAREIAAAARGPQAAVIPGAGGTSMDGARTGTGGTGGGGDLMGQYMGGGGELPELGERERAALEKMADFVRGQMGSEGS
jgi:hypothetical protein